MSIRVLVVDDSGFFRRRLSQMLDTDPLIEVIGVAVDGRDAINKVSQLKPDVITMDIEMPILNGIDATREIMRLRATPILMFSSLTHEGAKATLDALDAGALDYLPKHFDQISNNDDETRKILCERIKIIANKRQSYKDPRLVRPLSASKPLQKPSVQSPTTVTAQSNLPATGRLSKAGSKFNPAEFDLVAIGTSTGGPVALQQVLSQLPASFSLPIVMVQHMPSTFTKAFAKRLNQQCNIQVKEAEDGDLLKPGVAYLAPGGKQMIVEKRGGQMKLLIKEDNNPLQNYKPCVNVTLLSLVPIVGKRVQIIILTGMGADGRDACKTLKQQQAKLWAQDEASSTIYGMPAAVAPIADLVLPLDEIGKKLAMNC